MSLYEIFLSPFAEYSFMKRALAACIITAISGAPLGVFLLHRRMTLMSEAIAHSVLPGVAVAFLITGLSLWPMTIGGVAAGLAVALIAGTISRLTELKEDVSFTVAYLTSLALGVLLISMKGGSVDLLHILFGNVLAVDDDSLLLVTNIASLTLPVAAIIYRPLIIECFNPNFLKAGGKSGAIYHQIFLVSVVLNTVASFQVLGTLMAVGIMIIPAACARLWSNKIDGSIALAMLCGGISAYCGLLISYHYNLPSGPAVVLTAGILYIFSVFFGKCGGILARFYPRKHFHTEG